jgi:hypothetical protein
MRGETNIEVGEPCHSFKLNMNKSLQKIRLFWFSDKAAPSKFRPMGHFYCRTEKEFKFTAKFKFSSVPVMRTSFDKRLND